MMVLFATVAAQRADDGLTLHEVLQSLPTDPASLFTLVLLTLLVAFVIWAGRPRKGGGAS